MITSKELQQNREASPAPEKITHVQKQKNKTSSIHQLDCETTAAGAIESHA